MISDLRKILPLRLQIPTLFLFVMWLFFQAYQPWQSIDQDLLLGTGSFNDVTGLSDWQREQGRVHWSDDTGFIAMKSASRLRYKLPVFAGDLLLCSGRIRTEDLQPGAQKWDAARILVYFEDQHGRINWSHPHNVGYESGTSDWQLFTTVIDVPSEALRGWVELAHYGRSGIASFDDISVSPAVWKKTYTHWQMFFGMLWAAMMMWLILNSFLWQKPWGKALMATGLLIIVGVTLPPATMFQVASSGVKFSQTVIDTAEEVFPGKQQLSQVSPEPELTEELAKELTGESSKPAPSNGQKKLVSVKAQQTAIKNTMPPKVESSTAFSAKDVQKMGHMVLFALLGGIAYYGFFMVTKHYLLVYSLALFAFSTEVLQLVIDGRLFGFFDLVLDLVGIAIGAVAALVISHIRQPA